MELLLFILQVIAGLLICYNWYLWNENCQETIEEESEISWIKLLKKK